MKIELLTRERYIEFEGEPPPMTMKGLALIDGDDVLAILAVSIIEGVNFVVCGVKDGASKRKLIEGWKEFARFLNDDRQYFALIDEELDTAPSFLRHFNFEHVDGDLYMYRG